jgi:hypothetical protein
VLSVCLSGGGIECFGRSYTDEHPLALEVDVGDGKLVGERHDCVSEGGSIWLCGLVVKKFSLTCCVYDKLFEIDQKSSTNINASPSIRPRGQEL